MNDLDALHALLEANPLDRVTRLAIADWYEERGDLLGARAWRWIAREGKRPLRCDATSSWDWWFTGYVGPAENVDEAVFRCLQGGHFYSAACWEYPSRREAEEALVEAFRRALQDGWQPDPPTTPESGIRT